MSYRLSEAGTSSSTFSSLARGSSGFIVEETKVKLFQEGDCGTALCHTCHAQVSTTYRRRSVPFDDGKGMADDVLVGVCDVCGDVVAIPAQSTPATREARMREMVSVEARLPAVYVDVLDLAAYVIDSQVSTEFRKLLLTWFVHRYASEATGVRSLVDAHARARATFPERRGIARRRISMKVSPRVEVDFRLLEAGTALNKTELLKSVVWRIRDEVLESPRKTVIRELKDLSAVVVR